MLPSLLQAATSSSVLVSDETLQGVEQTNCSVFGDIGDGEIEDGEFIPEERKECMDLCERNRLLKMQPGTS